MELWLSQLNLNFNSTLSQYRTFLPFWSQSMCSQYLIILFSVLNFRQVNFGSSSIGAIIFPCIAFPCIVHNRSWKTVSHILSKQIYTQLPSLYSFNSYLILRCQETSVFLNDLFLNVPRSSLTEVRSSLWSCELLIMMRPGWGLKDISMFICLNWDQQWNK